MTIKIKLKVIFPIFMFVLPRISFAHNCGLEGGLRSRISGGETTRPNQYPWMVRFTYYKTDNEEYQCAGSLITDRLVLTAKHCMNEFKKWGKAQAGLHSWGDKKTDFQTLQFGEVRVHDTMDDYTNDIAIIVVKEPVDLTDPRIGTVCLPESDNETYIGETAITMGWGKMANKKFGHTLKHVKLQVNNNQEKYWLYTDVPLINGEYQDVCAGDSGGPLVHRQGPQWTVIGVVNGEGYNCDTGKVIGLGKWNKVTAHLNWIKNIIKKHNSVTKSKFNGETSGILSQNVNNGNLYTMQRDPYIDNYQISKYVGASNVQPKIVNDIYNRRDNYINKPSIATMEGLGKQVGSNGLNRYTPNRFEVHQPNVNMGNPGSINTMPHIRNMHFNRLNQPHRNQYITTYPKLNNQINRHRKMYPSNGHMNNNYNVGNMHLNRLNQPYQPYINQHMGTYTNTNYGGTMNHMSRSNSINTKHNEHIYEHNLVHGDFKKNYNTRNKGYTHITEPVSHIYGINSGDINNRQNIYG